MDNKNYTDIDSSKIQNNQKVNTASEKLRNSLNKNTFYVVLTSLIGISLLIGFIMFSKKADLSVSKIRTSKININAQNIATPGKTALNSADISDKNVFEKSTYDKSKEVKISPPTDPYAKKPTPTKAAPTKTIKKNTKTVLIAQKPTSTPKPTATTKPTSTPVKPTVTLTPTSKPTSTPKPTATTKPSATPSPTVTKKPTSTPVKPTSTVKPTAKPTATVTPKPTATTKPTATPVKPTVIAQKPTAVPTVTVQASKDSYTVKSGDNLWNISEKVYGTGFRANEIAKANNISKASLIYAGQKLKLPKVEAKTTVSKTVAKAEQKPTATPTVVSKAKGEILTSNTKITDKVQKYTVVKGDNLWNISVKFYGNGYAWKEIAEANKLANPRVIHSGNVLAIPAKSK